MTAERLGRNNTFRNAVLLGTACILMLSANILIILGDLYNETAVGFMMAANLILNIGIICDLCANIRRDFPLLVFVGSFNLLLMGRVDVAYFSDYEKILYDVEAADFKNLFTALQVVTLSILCVYAAYKLAAPLFTRKENAIREKGWDAVKKSPVVPVIRQISMVVLLVSSLAFFFILAQTILNVLRHGYLASFTQKAESNVPSVISRLSMFFVPSFAVFLATLPNRRQLRFPMLVYGVYMLASLFTGRRNTFVCEALMIVIYFVLRDSLRPKEKRMLKKHTVFWVIIVGLVFMYFLELIAEVRAGFTLKKDVFTSLVSFIYSQGASFRVVIDTVNRWDLFDHNTSYQFLYYPFEQFVHNNIITQSIFGFTPIIEVQNAKYVMTTHNFAHVLTYMVDPSRYLQGGGFGTSYVAEAYVAYGFGGVIAVSALVGVIFRFFSSMLTRSWVVIACGLIALKDFVYIPRNFAFSWVTDVFNITYLCYYLGIYLAAMFLLKLGAHVRETGQRPATEEET